MRHNLYMTQMNRKARSFEQIKAEQAKAEEEARVANTVEVAEGIFVDMRTQSKNLCFCVGMCMSCG